jgi:hypothetical protein
MVSGGISRIFIVSSHRHGLAWGGEWGLGLGKHGS